MWGDKFNRYVKGYGPLWARSHKGKTLISNKIVQHIQVPCMFIVVWRKKYGS
jgi:hypothetical protein